MICCCRTDAHCTTNKMFADLLVCVSNASVTRVVSPPTAPPATAPHPAQLSSAQVSFYREKAGSGERQDRQTAGRQLTVPPSPAPPAHSQLATDCLHSFQSNMSVSDHDNTCDGDYQPALDVSTLPKVNILLSVVSPHCSDLCRLSAPE